MVYYVHKNLRQFLNTLAIYMKEKWEEDGIIQKCEHKTLSEKYKNNILWIHPNS